jgi:alpha-D-xyloside xylohydrolase
MPLVPGVDATDADVKDQYMVGDALLVAPIAPGTKARTVVLPAGKWFDFYTGQLAGENQTITVTPPLSQIPLFVKDGGLVPMIAERRYAPGPQDVVALEVRHYGEQPGASRLYDDDGETFDYERGERTWTRLAATRDPTGAWHGEVTPDVSGKAWRYTPVSWTFMTPRR